MAEAELQNRAVPLDSELLTVAAVRRAAKAIPGAAASAIDASTLRRFTAAGLAELHELGRTHEGRCAVIGLPRPLLREAIAARLARHFAFYASRDAYAAQGAASSGAKPSELRRAVIHEVALERRSGTLDIAGRPLLVRQLQWLRDRGIEDVIVEVVDGAHSVELADLVLSDDPLFARCVALPSSSPLGAAGVAARAGIPHDEIFLALPAHTLYHGDFELPEDVRAIELGPPPFAQSFPPAELTLQTRTLTPSERAREPGWALAVTDAAIAHTLSCAALAGLTEGVLVHAAEIKPQIWLARGARVAEDATLVPPVLLGPDARVFARARVGPNVVIGRHAVVDRDAVISEVSVAPFTWVGDGARIRQAEIDANGYTSFVDGVRTEVRDPLLLSTLAPRAALTSTRIFAALLLTLLFLPWALVALAVRLVGKRPLRTVGIQEHRLLEGAIGVHTLDRVPALIDVVLGRRDLVGVSAAAAAEPGLQGRPLRPAAFDITAAFGAKSAETVACMVNWYGVHKAAALDWELARGALLSTRNERSAPGA